MWQLIFHLYLSEPAVTSSLCPPVVCARHTQGHHKSGLCVTFRPPGNMEVMWVLRWPIKALLFLSVALFCVYSVLITTNAVLQDPLFDKLSAFCYFPFIQSALDKGKGEGLGFLKEDVLYCAAVSTSTDAALFMCSSGACILDTASYYVV